MHTMPQTGDIPIDILEDVLPKLGINVPISKILKAVNEEQAKRHSSRGAIKRHTPSSNSKQESKSDMLVKESEPGRSPIQLAREFDTSFPDGKMTRLYSDDAPVESPADQ